MSFISLIFIAFLSITFLLYYFPGLSRYQVQVLIFSSMVFFGYLNYFFILVLLTSVLINVLSSYYIVYGTPKEKKKVAITGIILNICLLILFKYGQVTSFVFQLFSEPISNFLLSVPLVLGISFSTFQGISMLIDVYRGNGGRDGKYVASSFYQHARQIFLYKTFFPQLVSGPIVRVHEFIPQIKIKYFGDINWNLCFKNLITGYFLKMVVADNLKDFTYWIDYPYFLAQHTGTLVAMLFGYSCQIFADFAGYTLIAIGIAGLFGYILPGNFNFPYISTSLKEFWTRWHITLSTWLRDYIFLPIAYYLSGRMPNNKYLGIKTEIWIYTVSTMITFFICGVWHGVGISFILWGSIFGAGLVLERMLTTAGKLFRRKKNKLKTSSRVIIFANWLIVFSFVTISWIFFRLSQLNWIADYFRTLFRDGKIGDINLIISIFIYSFPIIIYHLVYLIRMGNPKSKYFQYNYLLYGLMIFLIILNSGSSTSFIYFQF